MKRLIRWLVAGIVLAFVAAAVGADGSELTVRVMEVGGGEYLVDEHGKLLYVFIPHGANPIPLKEEWSEEARTAFDSWEPLTVSSEEALDHALPEGHVLKVFPIERGSDVFYQVVWGGSNTRDEPFWPLYTFSSDGPLSEYSMNEGDRPPGYIENLWMPARADLGGAPAPGNESRLDDNIFPPGGPIGDSLDGGP